MFKLAICYIKKMKKNTVICIMGVTVSIIMIFSLIQMGTSLVSSYKDMIFSHSNYDLYIDQMDYDMMQEIYEYYKWKYKVAGVNFFATNRDNSTNNNIVGVEGEWLTIFDVDLEEGSIPVNDCEIAVERRYAEDHNLKVGDSITLILESDNGEELETEFQVSGIVANTASTSSGCYIFVNMSTARNIMENQGFCHGQSNYMDYILIDKYEYPEEDIGQIYTYLFDTYFPDISIGKMIHENETKYELFYNTRSSYYGVLYAAWYIVGFIAITMMIFLYYMMNINLQGKLKQFGILRAIGANRYDMARLIGYELAVYGVIGTIIGCVGGVLFNKICANKIIYLLVNENTEVSFISWNMILSVAGVVAVSLFMVWLCFWLRLRKKKTVDLIRKNEKYVIKKKTNHKNLYIDLILNNCKRNRKNSIALLITMTLAGTMIILMINGLSSISYDEEESIYSFSELEISLLPNEDTIQIMPENIEILYDYADDIYMQSLQVESQVYVNGLALEDCRVVVYSETMMQKLKSVNNIDNNAKVISVGPETETLEKASLEVFAYKYYNDLSPDKKTVDVKIDEHIDLGFNALLGTRSSGAGNYIILDEKYAEELYGFQGEWSDVLLSGGLSKTELISVLDSEYYEYIDLTNMLREEERQLKGILAMMAYMVVSIVFLTVFMNSSIVKENFEQRRKEIGMLRAIGMRKNPLTIILLGEMMVLILLSEVIAAVIAVPISMYVYQIMNDEIGMAVAGFVFGIPITVVLSGVVILCSIRKCMKEKTIELLRCED